MSAWMARWSGIRRAPRASATQDRATSTAVRVLGVLAGAVGVEHGIGDLTQGWRRPPGLVFPSWPDSTAFQALDGEPALSVVPNLAVSGLLSIAFATALALVCLAGTYRPHVGRTIIVLSSALLLVGGGFGPPLLGLVVGATVTRIGSVPRRRPGDLTRVLAQLRWWPLAVAVLGFLTLFPMTVVLSAHLPPDPAALVAGATATAFAGLAASLITARAHDRLKRVVGVGERADA